MSKKDPIQETLFDGAVDVVDATNVPAQLGASEEDVAAASVGNWQELGNNEVAPADAIVAVLGEHNRYASVTVGSLKSAEHIPDDGWNDPAYWPPFDSVNKDSFLAGGGKKADYSPVSRPAGR